MLYITTKLKRVRYLRTITAILLFPLRLPLFLLYYIGKLAEEADGFLFQNSYNSLENFLVKYLKWNEVAKKQYKQNPDKFKD